MTDDPSLSFLPRKQHCPGCGAVLTASSNPNADDPDQRIAEPGDVSVCFYCGQFMVIADDGSLRLPTPKEADEIADDADSQEARAKVLAFRRGGMG